MKKKILMNAERQTWLIAALVIVSLSTLSSTNNFVFLTPAQAQSGCLPGIYNPSHIVQAGDCYTWPELNKAMKAEGQQPIIVGNRPAANLVFGEYFTSNSNGSKGFNFETDTAFGQKPSNAIIGKVYTDIRLNDVNASIIRPSWASINYNKSEAEKACAKSKLDCVPHNIFLANADANNARVMFKAQSVNSPTADGQWKTGKLLFIFRDMNKGYGIVRGVDTNGTNTGLFAMDPSNPTQFFYKILLGP